MTRLTRRPATLVVAVLTAVLVATLGAVGQAPAASAAASRTSAASIAMAPVLDLAAYEAQVIDEINSRRKARGLRAVSKASRCIDRFSERWAQHLADIQRLEHRNQRKILRRCDLTWVGEAVASGTGVTPEGMVEAWMGSRLHRAVLMKPRANRVGMGARLGADGKVYGVLNFGDVN